MDSGKSVLILGIGNILWADEGFGVRAVEALHRHYEFSANVTLMDGGTQGTYLLQHIEAADVLVIFDAIDYALPPGTLQLIEGDEVPSYMGAKKMSLHQTGFQEVLSMAAMLDRYPSRLLLVGVQPTQLEDYGGSLRPETKACIQPAIDAALRWMADLGIHASKREIPLSENDSIVGAEVVMARYEGERPTPEQACRIGDERVLASPAFKVEYRHHEMGADRNGTKLRVFSTDYQ
ncbi:MAG: HyaD/HybD family hydrogenase maturation endopeptidase [Gammaproteobacteria bacterium]|nr:HyaD/HybD family hydrogenase maturation endopeptidase [Gammaproteobacteria bacterium]MCF6361922.1 HyaD/HybD family hydrogenase maturation endopeptidase [Gammaproteobacteria bacterium]